MPKGVYVRTKSPWNKGLTKETSPIIAEISLKISAIKIGVPNLKLRGKPKSEETKRKMRLAKVGYIPWNKGVPASEIHKLNNRLSQIGHIPSAESNLKRSLTLKGRHVSDENRLKRKVGLRKYWENLSPEDWNNRIEKVCSSVARISKNQLRLYNFLKQYFPEAILEHRVKRETNGYYLLDIALIEDRINFEYDSTRWHTLDKHKERDRLRDKNLQSLGWTVIRIGERELDSYIKRGKIDVSMATIGADGNEVSEGLVSVVPQGI